MAALSLASEGFSKEIPSCSKCREVCGDEPPPCEVKGDCQYFGTLVEGRSTETVILDQIDCPQGWELAWKISLLLDRFSWDMISSMLDVEIEDSDYLFWQINTLVSLRKSLEAEWLEEHKGS